MNCKCLKPIVVLLQACSGSLSLLSASPASDGSGSGRPKELDEVDEEDEDFENGEGNSAGEQELWDATIKLLRLLANLCIDETIGSALAKRPEALQVWIMRPIKQTLIFPWVLSGVHRVVGLFEFPP